MTCGQTQTTVRGRTENRFRSDKIKIEVIENERVLSVRYCMEEREVVVDKKEDMSY